MAAHTTSPLCCRRFIQRDRLSRANLSRTLGLTRVTASGLVSELLERGHVIELGQSEKIRPGKPAIMVDLNRRGLQIIGLNLAENSVLRAAVLDLDGSILHRVETTTGDEKGQKVTQLVLGLATRAINLATAPLLGIGTPRIVNHNGVVLTAPNLDSKDLPLRELFEQETGLPRSWPATRMQRFSPDSPLGAARTT